MGRIKTTSKKKEASNNKSKEDDKKIEKTVEEKKTETKKEVVDATEKIIEKYNFMSKNIPIEISIKRTSNDFVPIYVVSISQLSKTTELILEKIRKQLVEEVNLGIVDLTDAKKAGEIEEKFQHTISVLINKYFPDMEEDTKAFMTTYLIQKSLGLGNLEIMMNDDLLEEIVINSSSDQ